MFHLCPNLQALIEQDMRPSSSAEIVVVISNRPGVQGLKRASLSGIQTRVVEHKMYGSRAEFDGTIDRVLELVCLAGFTRILTGNFVKKWNGKLLNIHPPLLPSFNGANAQKQALQAGVRVTGCTVHFVAEEVDAGGRARAELRQDPGGRALRLPRRPGAGGQRRVEDEPTDRSTFQSV
ncbi:trifunctional purine biosynthetic protein adenosine-3-like [Hippoglossus hippoglossus]|uniref:trifunctional purine biosynthetic protein adenosine-3-like n=1 Tax=Hippoglossus hippoglossus TaxID=8267 RepID=UPI00148C2FFD|nr:trifunctional purine biosynthetic protein adenosine-3-like [Hippoglossus hippoglossus]